MKHKFAHYIVLALLAVALLVGMIDAGSASAQGADGVVITTPADGETVSGVVTITGAVAFPDFLKYDFFLKGGENMIWVATGYSPVINGNLLKLDTKTVSDGAYQIVVRKVTSDSNYTDITGPTFVINNGQTAPNPFPTVETAFLYPAPGKATIRVRNCTGEGFFVDYTSPDGFKSSGEISLPPWLNDPYVCPYADIAVIPGEYRGTAKGEAQVEGINYTLNAEAGSVYEMNYNGPAAGANQLYIAEIEPDERVSTDTGGLSGDDPTRAQSEEEIRAGTEMAMGDDSKVADDASESGDMMASEEMAESDSDMSAQTDDSSTQPVLPESGQAAPTTAPFAVAAAGLIMLMLIGGVFAIKRGKQAA